MSLIGHAIPQQRYELIRDRIFTVLSAEFANQIYLYTGSPCIGCTFWAERSTPIDKTESGIIVINTIKGDYSNKSQNSTHGEYSFAIDFMVNAKAGGTTNLTAGDKSASFRLQRLIGIVRYILEHPNYSILNFTNPYFIEHTEVTKFQIYKDDRVNTPGDASNTAAGQIIFSVRAEEITTPNDGILLERNTTTVYVSETDKGFQYLAYSEQ